MHAAAALALVGLVACGRIGFEPDDGHDEDGDGRSDARDRCPHVPDDDTDMDGDGVGDACDPNPTIPSESFAVFATMQPGDQPFADASAYVQQADALRFSGFNATLTLDHAIATARIELGFEIHDLVGSEQHQIAIGIEGAPYYFVELDEHDSGATRTAAIVEYTSANGYVYLAGRNHGGMHPGLGFVRMDTDADNRQLATLSGWIGELYDSEASAPGYVGGTRVRFTVNGLDLSLRYLALITTP